MAVHWSLLALLGAVAAGLVTATIVSLWVRSRQTSFFRYFLVQVLLFNLLILGGLTIRYVELQLRPHPTLVLGLLGLLASLKVGWLYAFVSMSLVLPGQELPSWFRRRFGTAVAALFVVWGALLVVALAIGSGPAVGGLLGALEIAVLGGAASASLYLILRVAGSSARPRDRKVALLGGVYVAIFVIMVGSLALGWSRPSGPTENHLLFNSAFMVLYNLLPLAWIFRFQPTGPIRAPADLDRFGITPREREVIDLICSGRTNQEIADLLFISLATVKDHNYNIFRKTGVRNRVELANLMRGAARAAEPPPAESASIRPARGGSPPPRPLSDR